MNNEEMVHWWQGFVIVRIRGERLERLINRMMYQRLAAWNVWRISVEEAEVSITVQDFFKLRTLLKETGCRMRIVEKHGLPFLSKKVKRRIGLYAGAGLFLAVLYTLSLMTWSVEVEGVKLPEDEHMIRTTLEDLGVEPWTFKRRAADPSTIRREIADTLPNVTWVGFEYRGTVANVKVVEKTLPDQPEPTSPRHLVASKKAVIHDIFVEEGQPLVKPNELVRPGDVLVSGIIGSENAPQIVSARGQVFGEVWYETNLTLPIDVERTVLTGERKDRYYLQAGPLSIPVWGIGDPEFDEYKVQDREYTFSIREWTFPLAFKKEEILASKQVIQNLTEEEALQLGSRLSRQKLLSSLDGEVEIEDENILKKRIEHGKVYIKTHYTVIEDITSEHYIFNQGD